MGRRYFQTKDLHGLFLTANDLRFLKKTFKRTKLEFICRRKILKFFVSNYFLEVSMCIKNWMKNQMLMNYYLNVNFNIHKERE